MSLKITMNIVAECVDRESAQQILMNAMQNKLCAHIMPWPNYLTNEEEIKDWIAQNWGDSRELEFDSGWIKERTLFLKVFGGDPISIAKSLQRHVKVLSVSMNYLGHDDYISPKFCGLWMDGDHILSKSECY
jgi:hypothetical protein